MEDVKVINNIEINEKENYVKVSVNPKIYPLHIVYSAAYVFLDKAFVNIEGNPEEDILVTIIPKDLKTNLEALGRDFNNELINYAVFSTRYGLTKQIREKIVEKLVEASKTD